MRTGYAIRHRRNRVWLKTRTLEDDAGGSLTVWVRDEADAMTFRKLSDAKRMLKVVRADSRTPGAIVILDPRWREVSG